MNWQSWSREWELTIPIRNRCPMVQKAKPNQRPQGFRLKSGISGCCSWYRFGSSITQDKLISFALECQQQHPDIEYMLIDDGWCQWGDWDTPDIDIQQTVSKLSKVGLKTGLWMAPFLATASSKLYELHPEYFIPHLEGIKIFPFDKLFSYRKYVLNFAHPEARQYIYNSITRMIKEWNISLLKLDFLYAPYFDPDLVDDLMPSRYLKELFLFIRSNFPHVYIMVCGCPFEPAKYLADSIRISDDISFPQFSKFPLINQLYNFFNFDLLVKKWDKYQSLSKYFNLDPDVLPDPRFTKHLPHQMDKLNEIFNQSKIKFYG